MTFKTGVWGEQAKLRSKKRLQYFKERQRKTHPLKGMRSGENHWGWKGDQVKYRALHVWIRKHLPEPQLCQECHLAPPRDLANISQEYKRALNDWEYLCRKCHLTKDGRIHNLKLRHKSTLSTLNQHLEIM